MRNNNYNITPYASFLHGTRETRSERENTFILTHRRLIDTKGRKRERENTSQYMFTCYMIIMVIILIMILIIMNDTVFKDNNDNTYL